jgi:hypothetical protein
MPEAMEELSQQRNPLNEGGAERAMGGGEIAEALVAVNRSQ